MSATLMDMPPRLASGVNFAGLNLTAQDGFLLSRIDGATSADDLCHLVGQTPEQLSESLFHLERLGVVHWSGAPPPAPEPEKPPVPTFPIRAEIEAELADVDFKAIDIDCATLAAVLEMEARLRETYWHALNLSGDPSRAVVKKAFFALSKKYHPDRFFGKELGPYKQRLERVFTGLKGAYDVLSHKKKKAAYAAQHPAPRSAPFDFVPGIEPSKEGPQSGRARSEPRASSSPRVSSEPRASSSPRTSSSPRPSSTPRVSTAPRSSSSTRSSTQPRAISESRPFSQPRVISRPRTDPRGPRAPTEPRTLSSPRSASRARTAPATPMDPETERRLEERRKKILAERKSRGTFGRGPSRPLVSSGKASGFYEDGLQQLRDGDAIGAEASFKLALAHDPENREFRERYTEASRQASTLRAAKRAEDAKVRESFGDSAGAAKAWASASDLVTSNTRYALRAAQCFLEMHEASLAWEYAERALAASGQRADVLIVASLVLLENGEKSRARPLVEKARALEPHDPRVKKLVTRVLT